MLRQWRNKNPELVRAQKRYYERKVWPWVPRTRQRKEKDSDEYDPDEILRDLFWSPCCPNGFKKISTTATTTIAAIAATTIISVNTKKEIGIFLLL